MPLELHLMDQGIANDDDERLEEDSGEKGDRRLVLECFFRTAHVSIWKGNGGEEEIADFSSPSLSFWTALSVSSQPGGDFQFCGTCLNVVKAAFLISSRSSPLFYYVLPSLPSLRQRRLIRM